MAHSTFISYKYSETLVYRDVIIERLDDNQPYYRGENEYSPDLSSASDATIQNYLYNKIYPTSVTIILFSSEMFNSEWMRREIQYSLSSITRSDRTSHPNGLVGVITPGFQINQSLLSEDSFYRESAFAAASQDEQQMSQLILNNRNNRDDWAWLAKELSQSSKDFNQSDYSESYLEYVDYYDFLVNPDLYIERAYKKSLVADTLYKLCKRV